MKTVEERIRIAEERIRELKAQAQKRNARQKFQDKKRTRAEETRRKIVAGAVFLSIATTSEEEKNKIFSVISQFVTRPNDRALFDLDPIVDNQKSDEI